MLKFSESALEPRAKLNEAAGLEIPKIVAADVKYWDSLSMKTKEEFRAAYDELEDNNDHAGCAYLIAKFAKNQKVMQTVLYICAIHFSMGSIPYELQQFRHELTNPLWKKIVGSK